MAAPVVFILKNQNSSYGHGRKLQTEDISQTCWKSATLAYLPTNVVPELLEISIAESPEDEQLFTFLDYFMDNWLVN